MAGSFAKAETLLNEDVFKNEHSQKLFQAIDELRTHGAHHEIELPELIIVGDQSAGKSSLLQSLTDIPFPVADRLCTRFPTRIVSRRTPFEPESIKISIEPSPFPIFNPFLTPYQDRVKQYADFNQTISSITAKEFKTIVDQATDLMGISRRNSSLHRAQTGIITKANKNFCNDVLKIEISGPDRSYFSILDLPGIFQSLTKDLTEAEKSLVKGMTMTHMSSKQSIIICVASGTNDLANQAVFDIASQQDSHGDRTVGVITKCDVSQHVNQLMDLARNNEKHFRHGWFVVRNRTPSEAEASLEPIQRNLREKKFFESAPWNALPSHRRGTQALKKYLADLLCSRIQETFPVMLLIIGNRIRSTQSQLNSLGEPRDGIERKRVYLIKLAQDFHSLASLALRGRYDSKTPDNVKLRRMVREANDAFVNDMKINGHTVPFIETSPGESESVQGGSSTGFAKPDFGLVGLYTPLRNDIPFEMQLHREKDWDQNIVHIYQSISCIPSQRDFSFEEIRLRDSFPNASNSKRENAFGQFNNVSFGTSSSNSNHGDSLFGNVFRVPSGTSQTSLGAFRDDLATTPSKPLFSGSSTATHDKPIFEKLKQSSGSGLAASQSPSILFGAGSATTPPKSLFGSDSTAIHDKASFGKLEPASSSIFIHKPLVNFFSDPKGFATETRSAGEAAALVKALEPASSEIYEWIRLEVKASRGTELQGILNPDILPILFHKQIQKWETISADHFRRVSRLTVDILIHMLETVCSDSLIRNRLEKIIRQASASAEFQGHSKLIERLQDLRSRHLQTSNPAFEDKVREAQLNRFDAALDRYRRAHNPPVATGFASSKSSFNRTSAELKISMRDTASLFADLHISTSRNLEDEIHDILKVYYEITMNDFVEFVNQLVIEPYLHDPKGPVLLFSPLYIAGLAESEIESLAAEPLSTQQERVDLMATLERLRVAERIAGKYS